MLFGIFLCLQAVFTGCSGNADDEQVSGSDLPSELQGLQGDWSSPATNESHSCHATFSGFTLRLNYKEGEGDLFKKNVSFKEIDQQRDLLIMYDDAGAWSYKLHEKDAGQELELEFYSETHAAWVEVCLQRDAQQMF